MKKYHYCQIISVIAFLAMIFFAVFVIHHILWLGIAGFLATGIASVSLANRAGELRKAERDEAFRNGRLKIYEDMRAILTDTGSDKSVSVRATVLHPASDGRYIWVDKKNNAYCHCDSPGIYEVEFLDD